MTSTEVTTTSGSHGNTMLSQKSSAIDSTVSSTASVKRPATMVEMTRCSRGNATLRTSGPLATMPSIAVLTDTLKKVQGSRPHIR